MKTVEIFAENGSRLCIAEVADNPWTRMKGLLGRKKLATGQGLLIRPCTSVHSFFMHFPIDVIYLDKENVITKAAYLPPGHMSRGRGNTRNVLELPGQSIERDNLKPGQRLTIKEIV